MDAKKKYGKYEVIEKIGQGGMGEVFKARDPILKRDVAIKTLSAGVSEEDDLRSRFEREAQLAAGLNHPNIVHIYDFGEEGGKIYMAMELLVGKDLKAAIKSNSLAGLDDKLRLMEEVCEGLAFAHFREIVHRDLKPANIHIQPDGRAKIMDFGLAKLESSDMTRTGVIMGTPDYMSPEQVQGGKADARSDVYSLGAVFYELLTGKRPFSAESTHALLFQVLYHLPDPVTKHNPEIPLAVQGIVERAMSKDPATRFQNGGEMRDALRQARQGLQNEDEATLVADISIPPSGPTTPRPGSGPQSPGGGAPATPVSAAPGTPMPLSGGPSGYPGGMAPGPGTPSQGSGGSMGPAGMITGSQAPGSYSQPTVIVQKSTTGILIGVGISAVAVTVVVLFVTGNLPGFPREDPAAARQQMASFEAEILRRDLEGARDAYDQKSFDRALSKVERILDRAPDNPEAIQLRDTILAFRSELEELAGKAQASMESGDVQAAAATVSRMLEMDPGYGPALKLSTRLTEQFQGEAERAREDMQAARRRAEQTQGARALGTFLEAANDAGQAEGLFDAGKFGEATVQYRSAATGFENARAEAQRIASRRQPKEEPPPPDPGEAEAARRSVESARRRAEVAEGAKALPGFVTANKLEKEGDAYFKQEQYALAAARYQAAAEGFEAVRQEAVKIARQKPAQPPPEPQPPVPQPQPATPPPDPRPAIRQVVASYERVFETQDLDLYRSIKPNISPEEERALARLFDRYETYEVAMEIKSIDVSGSTATVDLFRQDTMDGKAARRISQKIYLTRIQGDRWVIESLGQ